MVGGGEVDWYASELFDVSVAVELGAVVGGDGFEQRGVAVDELEKAVVEGRGGAIGEFPDQNTARQSLDEAEDAVLAARADDGIHLPVTDLSAWFHGRRSLGDVPFAGYFASFFMGAVSLPILRSLAQVPIESSSPSLVLPDVLVDRFMAHAEQVIASQKAADLLGAEILSDELFDQLPVFRCQSTVARGAFPPSAGLFLRSAVAIAAVISTAIALELSIDRAAVPAQTLRNCSAGEVLLSECR